MDFAKLLKAVSDIVIWYGKAKNPNPNDLMEQYKKLSGFLWFFAEYVADVKGEYNSKYFIRKIETVK